jgi:hypothetical protein
MSTSGEVQFQDTKEKGEDESSRTAQYRITYYGCEFLTKASRILLNCADVKFSSFALM